MVVVKKNSIDLQLLICGDLLGMMQPMQAHIRIQIMELPVIILGA